MSNPTNPGPRSPVAELRSRLGELTIRDEHRLRRKVDALGRGDDRTRLAVITAEVDRAHERVVSRRAAAPRLRYPMELPVSQRRADLLAAIEANQVVVVAGETGSGKTTQLPKLCLELGRGIRGMIGHTQPRRIAARSVAERVAEELGAEVGGVVGFAVRFTDRVSDSSLVKLMTDGMLLAEIQRDRMLRNYDTIIIDEAHERSLNVDFLLGYLQQLLPRRPDLKLIITSATIDPGRFSRYFGDAPVIEVSGRSYPVEVRYRPINDPDRPEADDRDLVGAICDAVTELSSEPAGDVLVFLSGEREIRDTEEALIGMNLPDTQVLPLYARLSAAEQHRIFTAHRGRRIVLATNVAETSLTVPGIKYVIDSGNARISRYSNRTKVQLLPIEPISQASATQRSGRCGRTSDGICVRLYGEDDFGSRPAFTDPEILRTNLASVILQMAALDLGPIESFGFIDPPDRRQIADGTALLTELGALTSTGTGQPVLTDIGRQLAQFPVDPRLARMIVEADRRGCVRDVLVLAAALSIQDPRERPLEHQQAADQQHSRFAEPTSDFAAYLKLWRHVREQQRALSSSQFRKACRAEYLNYLRIREWQDLFTQLRQIAKGMGITVGDQAATIEQVHRSLLAGLLSHVGHKEVGLREGQRGDYLGARGAKFAIFPGSGLARKQPSYVMAAELVETSRLWARVNAAIQPEWAEELAPHLVKRSYSEPHWERRRGAVVAQERVTLFGVTLAADRKVEYHQVEPQLSRELFIRHALVEGDWDTRHHFFAANRRLVAQVQDLESRARRRDILIDDESLFAFYDARIPETVMSAGHFDSWWKKARHQQPELLDLTEDELVREGAERVRVEQFPDRWTSGSFELDLSYRFEPGAPTDGVTVTIPLPLLGQAAAAGLDWHVPGLRLELVTALLRSLPKPLRRGIVPAPDTAAELVSALADDTSVSGASLTLALAEQLRRTRNLLVQPEDWDLDKLPTHLRPTYRVVDEQGAVLGQHKDLTTLNAELAPQLARTFDAATRDVSRDGLTSWDFDELEPIVRRRVDGHEVVGYPALVELVAEVGVAGGGAGTAGWTGTGVGIRVLDDPEAQGRAMWPGTRRLLANTIASPVKQLRAGLESTERLVFSRAPHGSLDAVIADCTLAAVEQLLREAGGPVWNRADFEALRSTVQARLIPTTQQVLRVVGRTIAAAQAVELALDGAAGRTPYLAALAVQERRHLHTLFFSGFIAGTPAAQLVHLPRYLGAIAVRLSDAAVNAARDAQRQQVVDVVDRDWSELSQRLAGRGRFGTAELDRIRWMIEELRVSVFAQKLGTAHPVSVNRIHAAMDALDPR